MSSSYVLALSDSQGPDLSLDLQMNVGVALQAGTRVPRYGPKKEVCAGIPPPLHLPLPLPLPLWCPAYPSTVRAYLPICLAIPLPLPIPPYPAPAAAVGRRRKPHKAPCDPANFPPDNSHMVVPTCRGSPLLPHMDPRRITSHI